MCEDAPRAEQEVDALLVHHARESLQEAPGASVTLFRIA